MAEYIDRARLLKRIKKWPAYNTDSENNVYTLNRETALALIQRAPAADVAPVVHSKWVFANFSFDEKIRIAAKCKKCDTIFRMNLTRGETENFREVYKYCPNCGAKMDEDT